MGKNIGSRLNVILECNFFHSLPFGSQNGSHDLSKSTWVWNDLDFDFRVDSRSSHSSWKFSIVKVI